MRNRVKRLVAVLALLLSAVGVSSALPNGIASAALYNCYTTRVYETGFARCDGGTTGWVMVQVVCKMSGTTQTWVLNGPTVGAGKWSSRDCPWPMYLSNLWYRIG